MWLWKGLTWHSTPSHILIKEERDSESLRCSALSLTLGLERDLPPEARVPCVPEVMTLSPRGILASLVAQGHSTIGAPGGPVR